MSGCRLRQNGILEVNGRAGYGQAILRHIDKT